jgi:hypothetical protein
MTPHCTKCGQPDKTIIERLCTECAVVAIWERDCMLDVWDCDGDTHGPWCREWRALEEKVTRLTAENDRLAARVTQAEEQHNRACNEQLAAAREADEATARAEEVEAEAIQLREVAGKAYADGKNSVDIQALSARLRGAERLLADTSRRAEKAEGELRAISITLGHAETAFREDRPEALATINEFVQVVVEEAIQWGRRKAEVEVEGLRAEVGQLRAEVVRAGDESRDRVWDQKQKAEAEVARLREEIASLNELADNLQALIDSVDNAWPTVGGPARERERKRLSHLKATTARAETAEAEVARLREAGDLVCRIASETYNAMSSWPDGAHQAYNEWEQARAADPQKETP